MEERDARLREGTGFGVFRVEDERFTALCCALGKHVRGPWVTSQHEAEACKFREKSRPGMKDFGVECVRRACDARLSDFSKYLKSRS